MAIPKHYTVTEIAERLNLDRRTVGKLFRGLPDVVTIPGPTGRHNKMLIPAPVLNEWYKRRGGRPEIEEADRTVK